jgi:hypothetical protein
MMMRFAKSTILTRRIINSYKRVSIVSMSTALPQVGSLSSFPKHGIQLSSLRHCLGSFWNMDKLKDLTTAEVCKAYVVPLTAKRQCSFCDLLKDSKHAAFHDTANVFVSHAWQFKLFDVVDALEHHFRDQPDIVIWFDAFSHNQHVSSTMDYHWWSTTFRSAIKEFGYTVMVLAPWNKPLPLTRAWCLFELWATAEESCRFEIAMSKEQEEKYIEDFQKDFDAVNKLFAAIDVQRSESSNPEDKRLIFQAVQQSSGFVTLNETVLRELTQWVTQTAQKVLKRNQRLRS